MQQARLTEEEVSIIAKLYEKETSEWRAAVCSLCFTFGFELGYSFDEKRWVLQEV